MIMEAGRVINQGQASGEPQMGQVYSGTYPAYLANSLQVVSLDKTGAQMSNGEGRKPTYSACTAAFAPNLGAGGTTDVCGIIGSASKQVRVLRFAVSGRATAANQLDVQLVKRSAADTAGSSTAANLTAVAHDSNDAAASAVVTTYTGNNVNPTLGTTVGIVRAQQSNVSAAGSGGAATPVEFDFGTCNDKSVVLNSASEGLYLNFGGAVLPAGLVLNIFVEWSEE
jgi:hypothetical protein